jgi:hypothetical protein
MSQSQAVPPQWWLLLEGATAGPFSHAQISAQLASGQLSSETLGSPVGTTQWRTLRDWNCFAAPRRDTTFPSAPGGPQGIDTSAARAPALPDMVHWLVNYGLFVSPVLWLINQASCVASLPATAEQGPLQPAEVLLGCFTLLASAASASLMFAGALYLRKRRRSGARLMIAGFSLDLALFLVTLVLILGFVAAAAQQPGNVTADPAAAPAGPGTAILCVIPLASGVFELVGLIWLLNRGHSLPLR